MILRTTLLAGALALSGTAAWAQGVDLGARGIVVDTYNNERALQEQAEYRAERNAFEARGAGDVRAPGTELRPEATQARITQREAAGIAQEQGLERVQRVRQTGGAWSVTGVDTNGDHVVVRVSREGEVLDVRRI